MQLLDASDRVIKTRGVIEHLYKRVLAEPVIARHVAELAPDR